MSKHIEPDVRGTVFEDDSPELSRTYAEALLGAAEKEGPVEPVLDELEEILDQAFAKHPQFAKILASPSLPQADKDRILVRTFEGRATPILVRFLRVLNRHGRLPLLGAVTRQARAIWDRRQNRIPVRIRSAVPLDEGQKAALHERVARLVGATPILRLEVDPELIGGIVIEVGDRVYDASLRNRLEQLRRRLVTEKAQEIRRQRERFHEPATASA